jgi:hypothetical protein
MYCINPCINQSFKFQSSSTRCKIRLCACPSQTGQIFIAPLKENQTAYYETDYITLFITALEACYCSITKLFEFSH